MARRLFSKLGKKIADAQARRDRMEMDAIERVLRALKMTGKPRRPRKRPACGHHRAPASA